MLRGLEVERALRKARNARENLIGSLRPDEWLWIRLVGVDEFLDCGLELRHTLAGAAARLFVGQVGRTTAVDQFVAAMQGRFLSIRGIDSPALASDNLAFIA
jgi:hypothetical protein